MMQRAWWVSLVAWLVATAAWAQGTDDLALEPPGTSAAVADPMIVILPTKGKGGPNLKRAAKIHIEKGLKAEDFKIVPFAKFRKAARKAKVKPKDLASPSGAQKAGEAAGATHVLVVEGLMEREGEGRRKKRVFYANLSLIEVASGDVVYTKRWALRGRNITKVDSAQMISEVKSALEPPPPAPEPPLPPEPEVEPPPLPEPPPAPEPPAVAAAEEPSLDELPLPGTEPAATEEPPLEEPPLLAAAEPAEPEEPAQPAEPAPGTAVAMAEPEIIGGVTAAGEAGVVATVTPEKERSGRWRPGLHAVTGVLATSRVARIRAPNAPQTPPCYCLDGTGQDFLVFPAAYLAAELFPLALAFGEGGWIEGIGLHAEGYATSVETTINASGETITSTVWGARGGLSYRAVFWDSPTAADFRLDLGLSYSAFPLREGAFPGVRYFGQFYVGGMFTVPLFTEYLALLAGGTYTVAMEPQGQTRQMGEEVRRHTQFLVQSGLRASFDIFEARLMFRYEKSEQRYGGATTLDGVGVQFSGAKLTDEYVGGIAAVGVAF